MNQKKTILIVEDNAINRLVLSQVLENDYLILQADNGKEALKVLKQNVEIISLILLDIVMPIMDGYEFLSILKKKPLYSSIPVIIMTQGDSEMEEVKALSSGAIDFLTKPYKSQIILHRVANMISFQENAALVNLLKKDRLTRVYSKEYFFKECKKILAANRNVSYDLIASDIENFKLINDSFGTIVGDKLLCDVANIYMEFVGDSGICCRFQSDQFICLIERPQQYSNDLFESLIKKVEAKFVSKRIAIRYGIYPIDNMQVPIEQMCDRALMAAKSIKGQYGKNFALYDGKLRDKLVREQLIIDCMETAIRAEEFEIYLQPKYRLSDATLIGAEALVRWNHPLWGLQMPGTFIPLFESNGFIIKFDQYVFDHTCKIIQEWKLKGYPEIPVSVNVSRAAIYNDELPSFLLKCLEKYDLKPSMLHLEITETAYTDNSEQLIAMVKKFRKIGFLIEMDDFGSGYSSLNMLEDLPIDVLKLDLQFIKTEMTKPEGKGILMHIIRIAKWMGLDVIAEGIETKEHLERLKKMSCDYGQGYYFSKPLPKKEFEALLLEIEK